MHYPKGIAFDKNLLLVFPKLTEQRGSGSQGWGRLGATEIKALDLHPLSPWHQETGVTVFDNDAPRNKWTRSSLLSLYLQTRKSEPSEIDN